MKRMFLPLAVLAMIWCAMIGSPLAAAPAEEQSSDELIEAGEKWRQLYEAGEWKTLRTLYTDDAVLMAQGQDKIVGADNIITFLQRLANLGASVTFRFHPEEAIIENGIGFVTANYRMDIAFPGREPAVVVGRSFLVYKRESEQWKLWRDMDNFTSDVTKEGFE